MWLLVNAIGVGIAVWLLVSVLLSVTAVLVFGVCGSKLPSPLFSLLFLSLFVTLLAGGVGGAGVL